MSCLRVHGQTAVLTMLIDDRGDNGGRSLMRALRNPLDTNRPSGSCEPLYLVTKDAGTQQKLRGQVEAGWFTGTTEATVVVTILVLLFCKLLCWLFSSCVFCCSRSNVCN